MNFDNFTDREKELYIALLRSVITNTDINKDNLQAEGNVYNTIDSNYKINVFINTEFEVECGPSLWHPKNGFEFAITPQCGKYDPPITAWAATVGNDDWDQRIFWDVDTECSYDYGAPDFEEDLNRCHFSKIKWTGDLSKDFKIWKSAALECVELFKKYHEGQLRIKFGEAS